MPLRVTESKDGEWRASLNVEFRIDEKRLGEALVFLVDIETEPGELKRQQAIIDGATRKTVLDAARRMFGMNGYQGVSDAHEVEEDVETAAYRRAAALFPEFEEARR